MNIIFQSVRFKESDIVERYVRVGSTDQAHFFDVDKRSKTIREYWLNLSDVPETERDEIERARAEAEKPYSMLKLQEWKNNDPSS